MIYSLLGLPRSGKTAFMVLLLWLVSAMGLDIRANCDLYGFRNFKKITPIDLIYLRFCGCGLDEAWSWLESRVSQSKVSRFESLLIFQSGKMGVFMPYTAQLDSSVDTRLRNLADRRLVAYKLESEKKFFYAPVTSDGEVLVDNGFSLKFDLMKEIVFGNYNTYERKLPLGFKELVHDVARLTPDRMCRILDSQIALVFDNRELYGLTSVRSCSKSNVEYALLRLRQPISYSNLVARGLQLRLDCLNAVEGF